MERAGWVQRIKPLPLGKYRGEIRRYLLLLLLPVLVLALLYLNVNQVITRQAEEYAELTVNHFYVQSSSMLHEMQLVSSAILRDSSVNHILDTQDAAVLDSLYICDIIRDGLGESPYVQHAYLICNKSGSIYSDQGLFGSSSLSVLLDKIGTSQEELATVGPDADFHILNRDGLAPYCIFPVQNVEGEPIASLIVTLQMSEFLRIFHSLDAELCAIFNGDVYISSYISGDVAEGFNWYSAANISALVGKAVTCKYIEGDGYTYMVGVSRESYSRPLYVIIKWFFIYAAVVFMLGYLYLYQITKKRYQRISAMASELPDSYKGGQSLEHIYENIRRSLEDYRIQREHFKMGEGEHLLYSLLATESGQVATEERFQSMGVAPGHGPYYVAAFFSSNVPAPEIGHDREGVFMPILFRSTIHELAEQAHISFALCGIPQINVAIFYNNGRGVLRETVVALCADAVEVLTHSCSADIRAMVSSSVDSVQELPSAYRETQRLHSFAKSIDSDAVVVSQEELQRGSGILLNGDFIRQQQILISTILIRKYDAIPSMVESILADHVSPLRKSYALAQGRLMSIANVLAEGVRLCALPDFPSEECADALGQADSVHLLLLLTQQVYGHMVRLTQEDGKVPDAAGQACSYIAHNLSDQNLNVTAICEAVGISVQKLTRMFQAQFGVSIAEYVNAQRIKLAKELLPDRSLTAAQIAQQVGYYNADTFTRNFRKMEGVTPTEYRKMLANK